MWEKDNQDLEIFAGVGEGGEVGAHAGLQDFSVEEDVQYSYIMLHVRMVHCQILIMGA